MILPEAVEQVFWQELQTFEEKHKMKNTTSPEGFGFERDERALVLRQLTRRIGEIAPETEAQINTLSLAQLEELGEALLDFSQPSDLSEWLRSHS
jgi:predicted transposase YdaD